MRLVGGASRGAGGTEWPAHHERTDRHRVGRGGATSPWRTPKACPPARWRGAVSRARRRSRDLLKIHRLEIDLVQKTPPIAQQRGSNLLSQIVTTLQDGHKFPGAPNTAEPVRLGILIGHEANVANIERLLNLGWQIPGFQANEASPGSALAFELFREVSTGQRYVRLAYFAQTPDQMRQATVLNLAERPGAMAVDLPACAAFAPRAVMSGGALRRDRQGRDRSRLRDDQALGPDQPSATARLARLVSTQVS